MDKVTLTCPSLLTLVLTIKQQCEVNIFAMTITSSSCGCGCAMAYCLGPMADQSEAPWLWPTNQLWLWPCSLQLCNCGSGLSAVAGAVAKAGALAGASPLAALPPLELAGASRQVGQPGCWSLHLAATAEPSAGTHRPPCREHTGRHCNPAANGPIAGHRCRAFRAAGGLNIQGYPTVYHKGKHFVTEKSAPLSWHFPKQLENVNVISF